MNKLGVYFGTEKQEALFRGDTSNTVVDRYFIYSCQAIGAHFCGAMDVSPGMVRLLAVNGVPAHGVGHVGRWPYSGLQIPESVITFGTGTLRTLRLNGTTRTVPSWSWLPRWLPQRLMCNKYRPAEICTSFLAYLNHFITLACRTAGNNR